MKSKIKEYLREKELHTSNDVYEKAERDFYQYLDKAALRCKSNGRKTVSSKDL